MEHKILLGLTTTPRSDWREKVKEIKKFSIKEIALFPTFIKLGEREELYEMLAKSCVEKIPHVHLRDDMESWELDFFIKKYKTEVFNIHATDIFDMFAKDNSEHTKNIYIENNTDTGKRFLNSLRRSAGICLDLSHLHDFWTLQKIKTYRHFTNLIKKYPIGCCHISAILEKPVTYNRWDIKIPGTDRIYSSHLLGNLYELDYVREYVSYLPRYISIELENSFKEQLEVKKRLEKIING